MATKFLEPGSSATFDLSMWSTTITTNGSVATATDQTNGQPNTIKGTGTIGSSNRYGCVGSTGGAAIGDTRRISVYLRLSALPSAFTNTSFAAANRMVYVSSSTNAFFAVAIDNTGKLRLLDKNCTSQQTGTTTLSVGTWYRLTVAFTTSGASVNTIKVYLSPAGGGAGTLELSATNITGTTGNTEVYLGMMGWDCTTGAVSVWVSDIYVDDDASLNDTGDIHVTAKRPVANGTTNGFADLGAGGSGYGTGSAPKVNERALSTTNGRQMVGAGVATTEEYNIEGLTVGDKDLTGATIVDYMGWLYSKSLAGETAQIIVNGASSSISLTSANTPFKKAAGSSTYPSGTGTDIGEITDTSLTTVTLFEAGIIFAYTPGVAGASAGPPRTLMGWGQ